MISACMDRFSGSQFGLRCKQDGRSGKGPKQRSDTLSRDFIDNYRPANRHERAESERFKYFSYADLVARDKASLDVFWLKDDSLDNLDDLPPPDVLQQEIIEHLEAALAAFRDVAAGLPVINKDQ